MILKTERNLEIRLKEHFPLYFLFFGGEDMADIINGKKHSI